MAIKKRCVGCGHPYDFYGGNSYVCPYCGEENNPSISAELEDIFLNAENLRRNSDFDKAYKEYIRCIRLNADFSEAHWGAFLCEYAVADEAALYEETLFICNNPRPVNENSYFKEALKKDHSSAQNRECIANLIEQARIRTLSAERQIRANEYNVLLLADSSSAFSLGVAEKLYAFFKDRVNVFYAPSTVVSKNSQMAALTEQAACKNINLCFAVFGKKYNDALTKNCLLFLCDHKKFMFTAIAEDKTDVPSELNYGKFLPVDEKLNENVLFQTRLMGIFTQEEQEYLRENGRLPGGSTDRSKKIIL